MRSQAIAVSFLAAFALAANAALTPPAKVTVDAGHPAHPISPLLWGIFFEDIKLSADGGIYPELVRNRSFEDSDKLATPLLAPMPGPSKKQLPTSPADQ